MLVIGWSHQTAKRHFFSFIRRRAANFCMNMAFPNDDAMVPYDVSSATVRKPSGQVRPRRFGIERFFAKHEFNLRYILSSSDCETIPMSSLLEMARTRQPELYRLWEDLDLGYTESLGHPLLRQMIADRYRVTFERNRAMSSTGTTGDGQDLRVMTCVPIEGIAITMSALLDPDDVVIAMEPCYQVLSELATARGCTVLKWRARFVQETGAFRFRTSDFDEIWAEAVRLSKSDSPRLVIVNTPHNPTGQSLISNGIMEHLYERIADRNTIVFSDEMYGDILDPHVPVKDKTFSGGELRVSNVGRQKTIVLSGLSKPQGLPGLRMGWLLMTEVDLFNKIEEQKDYGTICASAPSEILSMVALANEEVLVDRNKEIVRRNMNLLEEITSRYSQWLKSTKFGGEDVDLACTVLVALGDVAVDKFKTSAALSEVMSNRFEIGLVPSEVLYSPEELPGGENENPFYKPAFRFGLGRKNFGECIRAMEGAFNTLSSEF